MFKKTDNAQQASLFRSPSELLSKRSTRKYADPKAWHNVFRQHVMGNIDEAIFAPIFNSKAGAPNYSVRVLLGMMIIKEVLECSDKQLFEHCEFNLLVRSSLGLVNIDDPLPAESTYYLFRQKVYEFKYGGGIDLFEQVFQTITQKQVSEFNVSGKILRMDSTLIGSNIASYSRYELIHLATHQFYKDVPEKILKKRMSRKDREVLCELFKEESNKVVYHSTREEVKDRMHQFGPLIHRLLRLNKSNPHYEVLQKIFEEQYEKVDGGVILRNWEEREASSIQSPDDPDCDYRNKNGKKVKGYSANVTETCSDDQLNMITDIQLDTASTQDNAFLKKAIIHSKEVTGELADKVHCDGAYHSPTNTTFSKFCHLDLVLTGINGKNGRYDLKMTEAGLQVTDRETGEITMAVKVNSKKGIKWRFRSPKGYRYFTQRDIDNVIVRKNLENRTEQELNRRNNVEATIFVFSHSCIKGKSRYRKLLPNRAWAYTRGLAINIKRICKYIETTCQGTQAKACLNNIYSFFIRWSAFLCCHWTKIEIFNPNIYNNQKTIIFN
jgi:hypothetical protein